MVNFGTIVRAIDAAVALRDVAKRFKGDSADAPQPGASLPNASAGTPLPGQIEARLTGVVVAALKEAFDRDHARLELERAQLDEQRRQVEETRRRAEEAMRQELRRHAVDRELSRLRTLGLTALGGWVASMLLLVVRLADATVASKGIAAVGWLALLGALGIAFTSQARLNADALDPNSELKLGAVSTSVVWLLIAGLALAAISILF